MIKEIEKTVKETRRFCDVCEGEITYHCIKIDLESDISQIDYPKTLSETFDICAACTLKKVFPLVEKEFGIKPIVISNDEKL